MIERLSGPYPGTQRPGDRARRAVDHAGGRTLSRLHAHLLREPGFARETLPGRAEPVLPRLGG